MQGVKGFVASDLVEEAVCDGEDVDPFADGESDHDVVDVFVGWSVEVFGCEAVVAGLVERLGGEQGGGEHGGFGFELCGGTWPPTRMPRECA